MDQDTISGSTLEPDEHLGLTAANAVPCLTIVWHPQLERVGERCILRSLLTGQPIALSRSAPSFRATDEAGSRPLNDRYLTRRAVTIGAADEGGVRLSMPPGPAAVRVDGVPLAGERHLTAEDLRCGVGVLLGNRVLLLLHVIEPVHPCPQRFGLVGNSASMERLRAQITRVSDLDVPILLLGESGTGKELVARAIHEASARARGPWVPVNMGAVTPALGASQLFGHVRGAFTGAAQSRAGAFARARGGTLFLDEIGEMSPEVQTLLLRALETGEFAPVGADSIETSDARLVAATDADLHREVANGRFRKPLYYRIASVELDVPPLSNRLDDLGLLLLHFLRGELSSMGKAHQLEGSGSDPASMWLPASLVDELLRHPWPGNVRELRNVARQIAIAGRDSPTVRPDAALERLLARSRASSPALTQPDPAPPPARAGAPLSEDQLVASLREHGFSVVATARSLNVSRPTLYRWISESETLRLAQDIPDEEILQALDAATGHVGRAADRLFISRRALARRLKHIRPR